HVTGLFLRFNVNIRVHGNEGGNSCFVTNRPKNQGNLIANSFVPKSLQEWLTSLFSKDHQFFHRFAETEHLPTRNDASVTLNLVFLLVKLLDQARNIVLWVRTH